MEVVEKETVSFLIAAQDQAESTNNIKKHVQKEMKSSF